MSLDNCDVLPPSMSGESFPKGCAGAVNSKGIFSKDYCGGSNDTWWQYCCKWENDVCFPKGADSCDVLPRSMNGLKFPKGCAGAVNTKGKFYKAYCDGDNGRFPWWKHCCKWESNQCVPKPKSKLYK